MLPVTTRGEHIRTARERFGLTQEQLADRTGVSLKTLQRIENGRVQRSRSMTTLEIHLGLARATPPHTLRPDHETVIAVRGDMTTPVGEATFAQCIARIAELYNAAVRSSDVPEMTVIPELPPGVAEAATGRAPAPTSPPGKRHASSE